MNKKAFTMIELVFVIVVIGIISKVGMDILLNMYNSYLNSNSQNYLQAKTQVTINQISNRLQYRIKSTEIAKNSSDGSFEVLGSASGNENVLEWIGYDVEGFNGDWNGSMFKPTWSGIIDLDSSETNSTQLKSPQSDTSKIDTIIKALSYDNSDINDSIVYFIGTPMNVQTLGYDGSFIDTNGSIITIESGSSDDILYGNFSQKRVSEFYRLAWSAYAIEFKDGNLTLYYDYQPWKDELYTSGKSATLMENVDSFRFQGAGDMIKIQLCVKDEYFNNTSSKEYAFCKEKAVF
jgi:prepilin-type N-terminal cleavage/methylation domain-containing protein